MEATQSFEFLQEKVNALYLKHKGYFDANNSHLCNLLTFSSHFEVFDHQVELITDYKFNDSELPENIRRDLDYLKGTLGFISVREAVIA
jgi:hypothetical protein